MMDGRQEIEFLVLLRDKVDLTINDVAIKEPLMEISAMLTDRIQQLEHSQDA